MNSEETACSELTEQAEKTNVYNTLPYKRSRVAYNAEALLEYLIALTIADSFLAALGKSMGISDALLGICASIASFAGLTQMFTVFFNHRRPVKRLILTMHLVNQVMFACLYFLPFFSGVPQLLKEILFVALLFGGYLCSNVMGSMKYVFAMSSVERGKYGSFSTTKEMISLVGGMIFEYVIGRVATYYTKIGRQEISFLLFGITILVIAVLHAVSVGFMREDKEKYRIMAEQAEQPKEKLSVRIGKMFGLLGNRNFVLVLLVFLIWRCADYIAMPFMGTYAIDPNALNFELEDVAMFAIIGNGIRFVISRPVGRFADKTSYCTMLIPVFGLAAVAYVFGVFAAPGREWMFAVYKILRAVAYVGINSGTWNLMLDYVPVDRSDYAIALNHCIIGLAGFLSTLAGSAILTVIQENGNTVFGVPMFAQQFLSVIALVLILAVVLYLVLVVRRLKRVGVEER